MKLMRFGLVVFVTSFIAACGGTDSDDGAKANNASTRQGTLSTDLSGGRYTVGGSVAGLVGQMNLSSGSSTLALNSNNVNGESESFVFQETFSAGEIYDVAVLSQPSGQTCLVSNGAGALVDSNISNVDVTCLQADVTVSGAVDGLDGEIDVRLLISGNQVNMTVQGGENGDAQFEFPEKVPAGQPYALVVVNQPEHLSCTPSNGSGTTPAAGETLLTVGVSCEFIGYTVKGLASGLQGELALSLQITDDGLNPNALVVAPEALTVTTEDFAFLNPLDVGVNYEVTITRQPQDQVCTITNGVNTVSEDGVEQLIINCEALSPDAANVSGIISLAANIVADSDLNDPATTVVDNSTFATAQAIENNVTVQGFVTLAATGNAGDNFEATNDEHDYYSVTLEQGQGLSLKVVDSDQDPAPSTYKGDLDLFLFDAAFNLVAFSDGTADIETINVPADGQYYIDVVASAGASKYILSVQATNVVATANASVDFIPNEAIMQVDNDLMSSAGVQAMANMQLSHTEEDRATLAKFPNMTSFSAVLSADADAQSASSNGGQNQVNTPAQMDELANLNAESFEKVSTLKLIKSMRGDPGMMVVEPNYLRKALLTPNDEFYNLQWHYPAMNLPQAWDITTGSPQPGEADVIVAVIDTGVYTNHVELVGQLVPGYDFISNITNARDGDGIDPNPDDPGDSPTAGRSSWHGTHVAGTVAARSNNNIGVAGVSWGAKVMPLRVLGTFGGSSYDIMQAVRFAAGLSNDSGTLPAQRADVINLSLGGGAPSAAEAQLFELVHGLGIVVVAAAGNENSANLSYPAAYNGVVSVAALDANDNRAPYSNFGNTIDIAAPGGNVFADENNDNFEDGVLSTLVDDSNGNRVSIISFSNGTSMAAPHVAGMVALMKSVYPQLTAADFDALLQTGMLSDDAGGVGKDDIFGYGIANAFKSVQIAQAVANGEVEVPVLPSALLAQPSSLNIGTLDLAQINLSIVGDDPLAISSVVPSEPWLSVDEDNVNDDGFGLYTVNVDRTGLNDGTYSAFITFNAPGTNPISVRVSMTVGAVDAVGKAASIFAVIVDPYTNEVVTEVTATDNGDGTASFTFSDVPSGYYKVMASTDTDNDTDICQIGEACGAYPDLLAPDILLINGEDQSALDFDFNIITTADMLEENAPVIQRNTLEVQ